jgi:hypothetical protein
MFPDIRVDHVAKVDCSPTTIAVCGHCHKSAEHGDSALAAKESLATDQKVLRKAIVARPRSAMAPLFIAGRLTSAIE